MSKFLINVVETYRVDTDDEAKKLIEEAKRSSMFSLGKYSSEYKEVKQKGEVVESYYKVSLAKTFNDIKDPCQYVEPVYKSGTLEEESDEVEF